jgi:hypothetical protein
LSKKTKLIILEAYEASGITSFLQTCLSREPNIQNAYTIYCNVKEIPFLADAILRELSRLKSKHLKSLQDYINRNMGSRNSTRFEALLKAIPYFGDLISHAASIPNAAPIYTGHYASAMEEFLVMYLSNEAKDKDVILLIDTAQHLTESSYETVRSLVSHEGIRCILAITSDSSNAIQTTKLTNALKSLNCSVGRVYFHKPHIKLIIEIAAWKGISLEYEEAETL